MVQIDYKRKNNMNPLYEQMFNDQYVNEQFLRNMQQQYQLQQQTEIQKAVKAIHDYCEAARKISPEYQQEAFRLCGLAVLEELNK